MTYSQFTSREELGERVRRNFPKIDKLESKKFTIIFLNLIIIDNIVDLMSLIPSLVQPMSLLAEASSRPVSNGSWHVATQLGVHGYVIPVHNTISTESAHAIVCQNRNGVDAVEGRRGLSAFRSRLRRLSCQWLPVSGRYCKAMTTAFLSLLPLAFASCGC